MIRGTLRVGYERVREVTAETRKWCVVEGIEYNDSSVALQFTLMPHYFDTFVAAVRCITDGNCELQSERMPPLFVADIGTAHAKLRAPSTANTAETVQQKQRADAVTQRQRELEGTTGARELKETQPQGAGGGAFAGFSVADVARHRLLEAKRETQQIVNEQFRRLARAGRLAALVRLRHRGIRVVIDTTRWHAKSGKAHTSKRVVQLEATDDQDDSLDSGDDEPGEGGWEALRDPETGDIVRVYPEMDDPDNTGMTAMMQAARQGWVDVVEELLRVGADPKRKNIRGDDALSLAKAESNAASLAVKLGGPGAVQRRKRAAKLVNVLDRRSLLVCAKQGDLRRVRYMVEDLGDNPNETNQYGMTALHFAVMNKDVEMTKLLIANGSDIDAGNNIGQTPMTLLHALPGRDALTHALERAAKEGAELFHRFEERQARAVSDEMGRMRQEQRLARDLRQYTRGTTAARSVFRSFHTDFLVTETEAKRRLNHSAWQRQRELEHASMARDAALRQKAMLDAKARSSQSTRQSDSPSAAAVADSRRRGLRQDHAAAVKWMGKELDSSVKAAAAGCTAMSSRALRSDKSPPLPLALAVSWERHALNYYSRRAKAKLAIDARSAIALKRAAKVSAAPQGCGGALPTLLRTRVQHTRTAVSPKQPGFDANERLSSALSSNATAVSALAAYARNGLPSAERVPAPDDAIFEDWLRMRFGNVRSR